MPESRSRKGTDADPLRHRHRAIALLFRIQAADRRDPRPAEDFPIVFLKAGFESRVSFLADRRKQKSNPRMKPVAVYRGTGLREPTELRQGDTRLRSSSSDVP